MTTHTTTKPQSCKTGFGGVKWRIKVPLTHDGTASLSETSDHALRRIGCDENRLSYKVSFRFFLPNVL